MGHLWPRCRIRAAARRRQTSAGLVLGPARRGLPSVTSQPGREPSMSLSFTVGGARATFDAGIAGAVADVLDRAFGAEGDWEGSEPRHFGDLAARGSWEAFQARAAEAL